MFKLIKLKNKRGFTLIELLITIAIAILLAAIAVPIYGSLQVSAQLNENSAQLVQVLRTAKQLSQARFNNLPHGVKFTSSGYTLFQGTSYATRVLVYDRSISLNSALGLNWNLSNSVDEIIFSLGKGQTSATGTITFIHDVSGQRTIKVNNVGLIEEL